MGSRYFGILAALLFSFHLQAAEGDVHTETRVSVHTEMGAVQDQCEIEEKKEFNSETAEWLNPKPAPVCKPFIVENGPQFSNPHLSKTFTVFIGDLISAMTTLIDVSTFQGKMAPLPGHSNQKDMKNFSFVLDDWEAQTQSTPGMKGEKLKLTGDLLVGTTIYREAHEIHVRGGKKWTITDPTLKLAVRVAANVSPSEALLGYITEDIRQDCLDKVSKKRKAITSIAGARGPMFRSEDSAGNKDKIAWLEIKENLCKSLDIESMQGSTTEKAKKMLTAWKKAMIDQVTEFHKKNPELFVSPKCEEIKRIAADATLGNRGLEFLEVLPQYCEDSYQDIVDVINQGIQVESQDGKAHLKIQLASMNSQLEDRFPDFFANFKLDIVTVNSFIAKIGDDSTDIVFDVAISQGYERTHGLLTKINDDINSVTSEADARAMGKVISLGVLSLFGPKMPGLFKHRSTRGALADTIWNGGGGKAFGLAAELGTEKAVEGISNAKDATVEKIGNAASGIMNFLSSEDDEED